MRRIYLFCLFFLLTLLPAAAWANTWGVLYDVPEETTFSVYAVDNLIDKRPIRYAVSEKVSAQHKRMFEESILKWPAETLRLIQKSGRAQEFQDITPILKHELTLQFVSLADGPDIYFDFTLDPKRVCGSDADMGCYDAKGKPSKIFIVDPKSLRNKDIRGLLIHEIGHYFGLGDQYEIARSNSHKEYSSNVNQKDSAIMQGSDVTDGKITCDDVDGMINLIDLRLAQRNNNRFSARAQEGWKSLCPDSENIYREARTINRKNDSLSFIDGSSYQREYKDGRLQQEIEHRVETPLDIFFVPNQAKVERDPATHLIQAIYVDNAKNYAVTTPSGKTDKVPYERHFTYSKPTQNKGKKTVVISVREIVNGKKFQTREFLVSSDGTLTGIERASLDKSSYYTRLDDKSLHIEFPDDSRSSSRIDFFVEDNRTKASLEGTVGAKTAELTCQGKTKVVSVPPGKNAPVDCRWRRLWNWFEKNWKNLDSFYQNFYEPLFGTQKHRAAQAEQAREQIKQSLGTSR